MNSKKLYIVLGCLFAFASCGGNEPTPSKDSVANQMPRSKKRGVAFNFSNMEDLPLLSDAISWDYNWGNDQNATAAMWFDTNEMDFCPMCWNGNYSADKIRTFVAAHPNTKYLLAFNEPNLTDQANMTPAQAAALWPPVVALAKELNLKLVSPAMNYGTLSGYHDPVKWLDEFFAQPNVSIDDIDAISIHCYQVNSGGIQTMVENMGKYSKPIWVTEFCAWEEGVGPSSMSEQMRYMSEVINYMESSPDVERYAWFMPRTNRATEDYPYNQLLTKTKPYQLTQLGKVYCGMSSMDRSVWLSTKSLIRAHEYVALSGKDIHIVPSTEEDDQLMIYAFQAPQWVEYQVYAEKSGSLVQLRYATMLTPTVKIFIDGQVSTSVQLAATGSDMSTWATIDIPLSVNAGAHTIRIEMEQSTMHFAWLNFK